MLTTTLRVSPWIALLLVAVLRALITQDNFDYRLAVILGRVLVSALSGGGLLIAFVVVYWLVRKQRPRELVFTWAVLSVASMLALELFDWMLR